MLSQVLALKQKHCEVQLATIMHWKHQNLIPCWVELLGVRPEISRILKHIKTKKEHNFPFLLDQKLKMVEVTTEVDEVVKEMTKSLMYRVNQFAPKKAFNTELASSWTSKERRYYKIWQVNQ